MPRDSNGNTQPLPGTIVSTGDTVLPSQHNPMVVDLYAMMTESLSRDGQGGMRAILNMSGFKIINVGTATLPTDAVTLAQINVLDPLGIPKPFCGVDAPTGYLMCYGQAISRTTYAALFAAIGTSYGAGNGSTTFNIPDFRGRVLAGKDNMGGVSANRLTGPVVGSINGAVLGGVGGAQSHTLTVPELASHSHGISDPGHAHSIYGPTPQPLSHDGTLENDQPVNAGGFSAASSVNGTGISVVAAGSNGAHNNIQPTIIVNYILRTGI